MPKPIVYTTHTPLPLMLLLQSRRTVFIAAGQVVDEIDARDGTLVSRIISDLPGALYSAHVASTRFVAGLISATPAPRRRRLTNRFADPIIRLETSSSNRGHEYLCLISASNELRVWDIETRGHVSALFLGGSPRARSTLTAVVASHGHAKSLLIYAQAGTGTVEVLHLQRQSRAPGFPALLAVLSPKIAHARSAAVTALACHSARGLPLLAAGTIDGIVTVYWCPAWEDAGGGAGRSTGAGDANTSGATAASSAGVAMSSSGDGASSGGGGSSSKGGDASAAAQSDARAKVTLFAAAVSPDIVLVGSKLRRQAGGPTAAVTSDAAEPVTALAFHPSLAMLAAADATGRIVLWSIAVPGGGSPSALVAGKDERRAARHAILASRNGAVPDAPDGSPRLVTSFVFHAAAPRLLSLSFAPQGAHYAPLIQAWCTAHPSLPPLRQPSTPALAATLAGLVGDPWAAAVAHVTQPPAILRHGAAAGERTPLIWCAGRAVVTTLVAGSAAGAGAVGDGDADDGVAALLGEDIYGAEGGPSPLVPTLPLQPHGAGGISYAAPVALVLHAPRAAFVTGGEGDGVDLLDTSSSGGGSSGGAIDDLLGGSLAAFAAQLTASASSSAVAAKAEAAPLLTRSGLRQRVDGAPAYVPAVDAAVYIQARTDVSRGAHPRAQTAYSLQARSLGAGRAPGSVAALVSDSGFAASVSTRGMTPSTSGGVSASKRLCWLPSMGPCGPLMPTAVAASPSGRYLVVRFAYVTEADSDAAAAGASGPTAVAQGAAPAPKPQHPALVEATRDNAACALPTPGSGTLYVVVGPLTSPAARGSHAATSTSTSGPVPPRVPVSFETMACDVAVSPLCAAVDVALLEGDTLLAVRRPPDARPNAVIAASVAASAGLPQGSALEPSDTEYIVSLEPLDAPPPSSTRRFSVHEPVARVFPTPFHSPAARSGAASSVLLYATRYRQAAGAGGGGDQTVLRYSANAYGAYSADNPHGYALSNAFTAAPPPPPPAATPGLGLGTPSIKRGVSSYVIAALPQGVFRDGDSGSGPIPIGSGADVAPAHPAGVHSLRHHHTPHQPAVEAVLSASDGRAWEEHCAAVAAAPPALRPSLSLPPGEIVLSAVFSGAENVWADSGLAEGARAPSATSTITLQLGDAIASGGPLLALLTPLRLLIATPALVLLVAVPTLPPWGGTVTPGLGSLAGGINRDFNFNSTDGPQWERAVLAAPNFSLWRRPPPAGESYPATASASERAALPAVQPLDASASTVGGVVTSTVAAAAAAAAAMSGALPWTRVSDARPSDDVADEVRGWARVLLLRVRCMYVRAARRDYVVR